MLAEASPVGKTFNVCSGEATDLEACLNMASQITGHDIEVIINPDFVRENEVKTLRGSCEKLDRTIGKFRESSIFDTLEWMLQH